MVTLAASGLKAADEWVHLEDCQLVPSFLNDGDSFLVRHQGKKHHFRLYFVDCPEVSSIFPDRVAEQARYYGISPNEVMKLGQASTRYTRDFLRGGFSVYTRWRDAMGGGRRYAALIVRDGEMLSLKLAQNGLARIRGFQASTLWNGWTSDLMNHRLRMAEQQAKQSRLGGWGNAFTTFRLPVRGPGIDLSQVDGRININGASSRELEALPYIGKVYARRIIEGRPWNDVDSLAEINGITSKAVETLKPLVTLYNATAPPGTADYLRFRSDQFLNRYVDVHIDSVIDVNWPAPDGFVVLQAITAVEGEPGGAIPIFFPEEKLEDILRFFGDEDAFGKTRAIFYHYNGEDVLVVPRREKTE